MVTACECTTLDWPALPIEPGGTGELNVKYDSSDRDGPQEVTIDIIANTKPILTELVFTVIVEPKSP